MVINKGYFKMTRKDNFIKVVNENREYLRELGVISIGIFGSVSREEDVKNSDYDIIVEFEKNKKSFKTYNALCDFIEHNFGEKSDLITKESLSPYIGPHILEETMYVKIAS